MNKGINIQRLNEEKNAAEGTSTIYDNRDMVLVSFDLEGGGIL